MSRIKVALVAAVVFGLIVGIAWWRSDHYTPAPAPTVPEATEPHRDAPAAETADAAATAEAFLTAYLDPNTPRWRHTYGRYITPNMADLLGTVPPAAVTPAHVTDVTVPAVTLGYAVARVVTTDQTVRVTLIRGPGGWDVSSAVPVQ